MTHPLLKLLQVHAVIERDMQEHPWVNNRNSPIAEIAENLVAEATGGSRVPNNSKGWDVELPDGHRIEVKCRRLPENPRAGESFGIMREPLEFHTAALLVFSMDYRLARFVMVPVDEICDLSQYNNRSIGWAPIVRKVLARGDDLSALTAARSIWQ
jgi:hypothetical protein